MCEFIVENLRIFDLGMGINMCIKRGKLCGIYVDKHVEKCKKCKI